MSINNKFWALNPRKDKKAKINLVISELGCIKWSRLPPLSIHSFPETNKVVEDSFLSSTKIYKFKFLNKIKKFILYLQYNGTRRYFIKHSDCTLLIWNGLNGSRRVVQEAAKASGIPQLFFELGPLPNTLTVDQHGINYNNSLPRNIEYYLKWIDTKSVNINIIDSVAKKIKQRKSTNIKSSSSKASYTLNEKYIFIPLQVPDDSQLRLFGGLFKTVEKFLEAILSEAIHLPIGWHIRIKEHPSSTIEIAKNIIKENCLNIVIDNETETFEQVKSAEIIMTVNSSVGLEAMFFEKKVVACGQCFWAIPSIASSALTNDEIKSIFSEPDKVTFNQKNRHAFLYYLCEEYYINVSSIEKGKLSISELDKVKRKLNWSTI